MASMPHRTKEEAGYISDDDAVPRNNPTTTTELLGERLQAWKHMCGYLENYISEVAKDQKSQSKDQEKILKHISHPLKEAHHFEQSTGGVTALFENLRANTNAQASLHAETSKNLTSTVLPILERLHSEIKGKAKELDKGAGKGTKAVETARTHSQKHIELLGQHTAGFDSTGGKITAANDPYVLQRQVDHRLHKQLLEENSSRDELIGVQNSFAQFEAHVLQTVQTALSQFNQYMSGQADRQKAMYGDVAGNAGRIPSDFEWRGFIGRNGDKLIDPNAPKRSMSSISYPNQNHKSTQPIITGTLERKGKGLSALSGYSSNYYAITPSGFLHEYKDNDNHRHDPTPETSLYLPDCVVGALDGTKFAIKGKDTSGGKFSQKLSSTSEYTFKATTPQDAAKWHEVITAQTSGATSSLPNSPTSPVQHRVEPINTQTEAAPGAQQHGIVGQEPYSAGGSAIPQSATSQHAPQYNTAEPYSTNQPASLNTGVATQQGTGFTPHSAGGSTNPNVKY